MFRTTTKTGLFALLTACLGAAALAADAPPESAPQFTLRELGSGVHLVVPVTPAPDAVNALVVERSDGLLVVEAQPTPAAARSMLSSIARTIPGPVRLLVLSHPHAESSGGATAFPASTVVIAADGYEEAIADESYDFGAESRELAGDGWTDPPRRRATLTLSGRATLADGDLTVVVQPIGQAHTRGDLIVEVPERGVLWLGGLVVPPRNAVWAGADSRIGSWLPTINALLKSESSTIVGLRAGPLDRDGLRALRDSLAWLRGQVENAFIERVPLESMRARVLAADDIGRFFDDPADDPFLPRLIDRVIDEAVAQRRKRGVM